jgi:hypothetical protein
VVTAAEPVVADEAPLIVESTWLPPESELAEAAREEEEEEEAATVAVASVWLAPFDVVVSAVGLAGKLKLKPVQQGR